MPHSQYANPSRAPGAAHNLRLRVASWHQRKKLESIDSPGQAMGMVNKEHIEKAEWDFRTQSCESRYNGESKATHHNC